MKKTDLAYIAGIMDAEGSICIARERKRAKAGLPDKMAYMLSVNVGNTNEWLVKWFHFIFGGVITRIDKHLLNQKDMWLWVLSRRQGLEFLYLILPYLRLKNAQAELAIEFQEGKRPITNRKSKTEEELAVEEAQRVLMHELNRKIKRRVEQKESEVMSKVDWAYLAGFMDGDGSIYIQRCLDRRKLHRFNNCSYALTVQVGITDEWFVRWLKAMFGGNVWMRPTGGLHVNQTWYWRISQRQALDFLKPLLPYLRLKRGQAEMGIKFQANKRVPIEYTRVPKTEEEFQIEEEQAGLVSGLNKKGI